MQCCVKPKSYCRMLPLRNCFLRRNLNESPASLCSAGTRRFRLHLPVHIASCRKLKILGDDPSPLPLLFLVVDTLIRGGIWGLRSLRALVGEHHNVVRDCAQPRHVPTRSTPGGIWGLRSLRALVGEHHNVVRDCAQPHHIPTRFTLCLWKRRKQLNGLG
jgi:hypothetical protein